MTKNVKDCAILLEVISTFDKKDSTSIDFKRNNYSSELTNNIKGKKIGIPKEYRVDGMPQEIEKIYFVEFAEEKLLALEGDNQESAQNVRLNFFQEQIQ